jgi:hypothetical protein
MARYRHKSEDDLAWNRIRRRITRELDSEIQNAREEALNAILTKAWEDYTTALGQGTVPEIESKYSNLARAIVEDVVQIPELVDSDAADVA